MLGGRGHNDLWQRQSESSTGLGRTEVSPRRSLDVFERSGSIHGARVNQTRVIGRSSTREVDAIDHASCPPPQAHRSVTLRRAGEGEAGRPLGSPLKRHKDDRALRDAGGHGNPVGQWLNGATAPFCRHRRASMAPKLTSSQTPASYLNVGLTDTMVAGPRS